MASVQPHAPMAVMLYTDLANPTSNSIHQRIGCRSVTDHAGFHLG